MINFTVGPVQSDDDVRKIGAEQVPYFRTPEFSNIMYENEKLMLQFVNASSDSRAVFITGSGTASMEAAVMNVLGKDDKALVVCGGSFGKRFSEICSIHEIEHDEIILESGKDITKRDLEKYDGNHYTALLVNIHETSTGVLYNIELLSEFCKKNNLIFIVDAISAFIADNLNMKEMGIDVLITGSQKALAVAPGISIIVLSHKAIGIVNHNHVKSLYFDLKSALKDGERGQTPFTPAVGILRQIYVRLTKIKEMGGIEFERRRIAELAQDFRDKIKDLPFEIASESLSNAVTPLTPKNPRVSAYDIFTILKDEYQIWVCPNGGELKEKIFRVGHIGSLTTKDNDILISALNDMKKRKLL